MAARSSTLFAFFFAAGLLASGSVWMTVQRHRTDRLSQSDAAVRAHDELAHWLSHGYFASSGLLVYARENAIYRSSTGGYRITGFLAETVWTAFTGHYGWRLLALHNALIGLLNATLLALLAYRLALRLGAEPLHALLLGVTAQIVQLTFPDNLALVFELSAQTYWLLPTLAFLLLEERAAGNRTRRLTVLQAIAIFAMTYLEFVCATMFLAAYLAAVLLLRGERPSLRRLAAMLLLPWLAALAIYGIQLTAARQQALRTGATLTGSGFLYRTGLDGDAALYGDHLDIAFGRDLVRAQRPGHCPSLFRWPTLFVAGIAAVLALLAAYLRGRAPRPALIPLVALLGTYLLYAAVFSQAVAMHPYLYDTLLATPLILALFALLPALAESHTTHTGTIVLITLFTAAWLAMFQLRLYALAYPIKP